jgi:hypothetical protein
MNPNERRWLYYFALAVMVVTCVPYLLAFSQEGQNWRFSGFLFGVEDGNSYIANIRTGSAGSWVFRTPYTTYPQNGTIIFIHYLLLGKLVSASAPQSQFVMIYHIFRIISGFLAILATYDFLALFIKEIRFRRICTALVTIGGGLGWVVLFLKGSTWLESLPVEFLSPEAFGFLSLLGFAHLALARAFLLWGLRAYLLAGQTHRQKNWLGSLFTGVLWLLTALAQPLVGMIVGAVPVVHLLVTAGWLLSHREEHVSFNWAVWKQYLKRALIAGAVAGPFVLYNAVSFSLDPFLKLWNQQSAIPSPNPVYYLLAYGLILPFAIFGSVQMFRREPWLASFLVPWIIVFMVAIYLPFSQQRRLLEGVWVALVALAGYLLSGNHVALEKNRSFFHKTQAWIVKFNPVLFFSFIPTVLFFTGIVFAGISPIQPRFEPAKKTAAFEYLARIALPDEVVLSSYQTGNALPAWSPVRVVIGMGTLSANADLLQSQIAGFYQPITSMDERQKLLGLQRVQYVFWGPEERSMGDWDPHEATFLKPIFEQDGYSIFRVVR